jgi:hypothetical protein
VRKKLFDAIIGDLLSGVDFEQEFFSGLTSAINESLRKKTFQESDFPLHNPVVARTK